MDEKRLAEIEARANAATPGPWEGGTDPHDSTIEGPRAAVAFVNEHKNDRVRSQRGEDYSMADASFIAAARTDVPDLVAEVRRLTAALDAVTTERDDAVARAESAESAFADVQVQWRAEMARLRAEHAAALATARREGAEGMQQRCEETCASIASAHAERFVLKTAGGAVYAAREYGAAKCGAECVDAIRTLPLDAPGGGS